MVKRTPKYYPVLIMLIISTAITYWIHSRPVKVLYTANLAALPANMNGWHGKDAKLDASTKQALDADEVLSRNYINQSMDAGLNLLVVYRKLGRRGFAHRPEMCYPAQGWEIISKSYTTVPYGGKDVQAVRVVAQKNDEKDVIIYWFASGRKVEASFVKQQLWMALDRLQTRKYGWAFIRISSPVIISEDDTMKQIRSFVKSASNPLIGTLTGSQDGRTANVINSH